MNWDTFASLATAVGVGIAAWQIWESKRLASAAFEDSFDQQYRELSFSIPVNALLGKSLTKDEKASARESVYNYLDLCNEQIFQRKKKRISKDRWNEWALGIRENISRPYIGDVWREVKDSAKGSFSFLERLEQENFESDPADWKNS